MQIAAKYTNSNQVFVHQPISNQSTSQSAKQQSVHQPNSQSSINPPAKPLIKISPSVNQPISNQSISQSAISPQRKQPISNQSTSQSANQESVNQPISNQSTRQSACLLKFSPGGLRVQPGKHLPEHEELGGGRKRRGDGHRDRPQECKGDIHSYTCSSAEVANVGG